MADSKYTPEQLAEMAEECLCAYNSGKDPRADMVIGLVSSMMQIPQQAVISELYRLCAAGGR